jgi:hypothetical protein
MVRASQPAPNTRAYLEGLALAALETRRDLRAALFVRIILRVPGTLAELQRAERYPQRAESLQRPSNALT